MWASATVIFFYMLTPYAFFPIIMLAISGVVTFFQLISRIVDIKEQQIQKDIKNYSFCFD